MCEDMIVRYAAPTLAGMKAGSLFSCPFTDECAMRDCVRAWNREISEKGVKAVPVSKTRNGRTLIYVYRSSKLQRDLSDRKADSLLKGLGYDTGNVNGCVMKLLHRIRGRGDFPHETGLFLGYPPEDVDCFMKTGGRGCKCVGCWKVYGDAEAAESLFRTFRKCTMNLLKRYNNGQSIGSFTIAV
jgi:hypothetical protein